MGARAVADMVAHVERTRSSRRTWFSRLVRLAAVVSAALILAACARADFKMYVQNGTDEVWLVRVPMGIEGANLFSVTSVEPHSEGVAAAWLGEQTVAVELLKPDCTVVGIFAPSVDLLFSVAGVDGVSGRVSPFNPLLDSLNTPGVTPLEECGGSVTL